MKHLQIAGGHYITLDLLELIRINQLVRDRVDMEAFRQWYGSLKSNEQIALLVHLDLFAQQAGYDERMIESAAEIANFSAESSLLMNALAFCGGFSNTFGDKDVWLSGLSVDERCDMLTFFVHLFALAANASLVGCTVESCNHWWHRDLSNENVVEAILSDPNNAAASIGDDG